jgi:hypothetical protein
LRLTVNELGIGPPFGTLDQILSCSSFSSDNYFILLSKAPSLTGKRVCSLQCNHPLVRAVTPNNHTLPSHLRLCSLFVASYDSQGLWWKYSNPPPHGDFYPSSCLLFKTQLNPVGLSVPHRKHITSPLRSQQVNAIYRFVTMIY